MATEIPKELDSYLEQAGFDVIRKFGGFEEEEFNPNYDEFFCKYICSVKSEYCDCKYGVEEGDFY